jgi:hypothetical protein
MDLDSKTVDEVMEIDKYLQQERLVPRMKTTL